MATSWNRERSTEKGQTGSCKGYGSREDRKNGGRVLSVIRGYMKAGGQASWHGLGTSMGLRSVGGLSELIENYRPFPEVGNL